MINLPISLPVLILTAATFFATFLYIREYNKRKKFEAEGEKVLEKFKEQGLANLEQTIEKSENIISEAEKEGVKIEGDFKLKLDEIVKESETTIKAAQGQLVQFMQDLQKRSLDFEAASQKITQDRINRLFENLEQRLSDFLVQTSQKTTTSIELEVKASRELIESYKEQQLKIIDENILAMMEQTLSIVLGKKLSLKEQLDLIYEALEKAKAEKFIL